MTGKLINNLRFGLVFLDILCENLFSAYCQTILFILVLKVMDMKSEFHTPL
jgi:hypothetical protein